MSENTTIESYLFFCEKMLSYYEKHGSKSVFDVKSGLKNYIRVFNETKDGSKHEAKFVELFHKCRDKLIEYQDEKYSMDHFVEWYRKEGLKIEVKEGSKAVIHCSELYDYCEELATYIINKREEFPDDEKYESSKLDTYPEEHMKLLFGTFTLVDSKMDREKLIKPYIEILEGDDEDDGFGGLLSTIGEKTGIDTGGRSIKDIFSEMKESDEFGDAIKTVLGGVKDIDFSDKKSIGNAFNSIIDKVTENVNEVPEGVQRALDEE